MIQLSSGLSAQTSYQHHQHTRLVATEQFWIVKIQRSSIQSSSNFLNNTITNHNYNNNKANHNYNNTKTNHNYNNIKTNNYNTTSNNSFDNTSSYNKNSPDAGY